MMSIDKLSLICFIVVSKRVCRIGINPAGTTGSTISNRCKFSSAIEWDLVLRISNQLTLFRNFQDEITKLWYITYNNHRSKIRPSLDIYCLILISSHKGSRWRIFYEVAFCCIEHSRYQKLHLHIWNNIISVNF